MSPGQVPVPVGQQVKVIVVERTHDPIGIVHRDTQLLRRTERDAWATRGVATRSGGGKRQEQRHDMHSSASNGGKRDSASERRPT
jgi:hypothetical protein